MVKSAARHLEDYAGVSLLSTHWRMTMRHFPPVWNDPLDLPMPPFDRLLSIEIRGERQNLDDYAVEIDESAPARLYPKSGFWPWAWGFIPESVAIDWIAGVRSQDEVATPLRQAILMAVAFFYEQRESTAHFSLYPVIELGWQSLLGHYRAPGFA